MQRTVSYRGFEIYIELRPTYGSFLTACADGPVWRHF